MTADITFPVDHETRRQAARKRAEYELGDASWADVILKAYYHPDLDQQDLAREMAAD